MLRTWMLAVTLSLGLGAATDAWAVSKEELKEEKDRYKDGKKRWKNVDKLVGKWIKAKDKNRSTDKIDADLRPYYDDEMSWLRHAGVEMKESGPEHPSEQVEHNKPIPEDTEDRPYLEDLRDIVKRCKSDPKRKDLNDYAGYLERRYLRYKRIYDEDKAKS